MIVAFLRMIRFSHTIFALPFALAAVVVIGNRYSDAIKISWVNTGLIVIAFTGMRSFAMAVNRYADRHIDALNPRTQNREIPAGILSPAAVVWFGLMALLVLVVSAWLLSPIAGILALPAALVVAGYSLAKRFTWLCHFWLGAAIGLAPSAVYIALLQKIYPESLYLSAALCFYIAGFDILYAMQDRDFDREHKLYSIPARFEPATALWISRASHMLVVGFIGLFLHQLGFSLAGMAGLGWLALLFIAEHALIGSVKNPRYEKIPVAFFNVNSIFSLSFLAVVAAAVWFA